MHRVALLSLLVACGGATPRTPATNHSTSDTLAIAFVYNAQEIWMGNDDLEAEDSPARHMGVLKDLVLAVDRADFARSVPSGTLGLVVTYNDKAVVRVPVGAITTVTGAALGTQKDYYGKMGSDMVNGIELAMVELDKTAASKKVIIIFGDGNDTNNDAAKTELAKLKTDLAADQITPYAIIYKTDLSDAANIVKVLVPDAETINTSGTLPVKLARILHDCCRR